MKQKIHNEWFQPIKLRTCSCGAKKTNVYSWGNYIYGKWRSINYCCENCFAPNLIPKLLSHAQDCGCSFNLLPRSGFSLPDWIIQSWKEAMITNTCAV